MPVMHALALIACLAIVGAGAGDRDDMKRGKSAVATAKAKTNARKTKVASKKGSFSRDVVDRFEGPERVGWQKPAEVVAALNIRRGDRVADIGAGTGYFSIPFARAVGEGGAVFAVDTDPGLIAHLEKRAERENAPMVKGIVGTADDPKLPEVVDLVFIGNTFHHIGDRPAFFAKLRDSIKPNTRIAIINWKKRKLPMGPPSGMKIADGDLIEEMQSYGFRLKRREDFLPYQYFLVFTGAPSTPERIRPIIPLASTNDK